MLPSYRKQSTNLHSKSLDWFLLDKEISLDKEIDCHKMQDSASCLNNYCLERPQKNTKKRSSLKYSNFVKKLLKIKKT